ncbi:hypothetical protein [Alloactinosynnema sp. L-07]|uniref:DUF4244 domain-containing protein n=1 Tax=Alloactinosynnema sp. L-07 TaxID=1653480 RepID=UPI00065EF400|nr:DUF4244 domain-containing protein [Alloactinosynnema sp. L-07]CRK61078.1 hypothetical protein [Alloactinosynnema sp. L-07]
MNNFISSDEGIVSSEWALTILVAAALSAALLAIVTSSGVTESLTALIQRALDGA